MAEPDRPRSPFAGMADLSARPPVRVLSPDEIERMLAEHRLYLETEYHQGHRANFASANLTGRDFSGLNLRGIKMDRALLLPANGLGCSAIVRFPIISPITPGCSDVPGSGLRLTDIAGRGSCEALISAASTLTSGKSRAVDSEFT